MQLVLDIDPGSDDAFALVWLLALDLRCVVDIVGVSTVEGALPRRATFTNASRVLELCRRDDLLVAKSASHTGPNAENIHGADGLNGAAKLLPESKRSYSDAPRSPSRLIRWLQRDPSDITLIATGPLTNLAAAEAQQPGVLKNAKQIVLLGGSFQEGNATDVAEFNAHSNPAAWQTVLRSGANIVVVPLDISRQLEIPMSLVKSAGLRADGNRISSFLFHLAHNANLRAAKIDAEQSFTAHPAAAMAYALYPELFETVEAHVSIVTSAGQSNLGRTVIRPKATANALVTRRMDFETILERMLSSLDHFATRVG